MTHRHRSQRQFQFILYYLVLVYRGRYDLVWQNFRQVWQTVVCHCGQLLRPDRRCVPRNADYGNALAYTPQGIIASTAQDMNTLIGANVSI